MENSIKDRHLPTSLVKNREGYPYQRAGSFKSVGYKSVASVRVSFNKSSFVRYRRGPRLQDLDECMFVVLLNSTLAEKVRKIKVVGNEYILQEFSEDKFHVSLCDGDPRIDYIFTKDELADKWAVLRPESASAFICGSLKRPLSASTRL